MSVLSLLPHGKAPLCSHRTLQTVMVFLVMITSGVQYLVLKMNYNRDLRRIEEIVGKARTAAWGAKLSPVEGQRKVNCFGALRLTEVTRTEIFVRSR